MDTSKQYVPTVVISVDKDEYLIPEVQQYPANKLARRGGIKRMSSSEAFYDNVRSALYQFLDETIADASHYSNHARRQTITALDVVHALKRRGITLYGYGG
jgi:histone H3/H4